MEHSRLDELIDYYRLQGAPADQFLLTALLKDVQEACGGVLTGSALETVASALQVRLPILHALIRRIPSLRLEEAPHLLEICGTCRQSVRLAELIEEKYRVKSGGVSEAGKFSYRITGCMKNCRGGPSVRWDGQLYSHADMELLSSLIGSPSDKCRSSKR